MIFSKFLGSLDFCFFVSRQRIKKEKNYIIEENNFKDLVPELSGFYLCGMGASPDSRLQSERMTANLSSPRTFVGDPEVFLWIPNYCVWE
jgi:hypothetical protein